MNSKRLDRLLKAVRLKSHTVYIVLEHHSSRKGVDFDGQRVVRDRDEHVHGVYSDREAAKTKKRRLEKGSVHIGYISVLKFRIKGE